VNLRDDDRRRSCRAGVAGPRRATPKSTKTGTRSGAERLVDRVEVASGDAKSEERHARDSRSAVV